MFFNSIHTRSATVAFIVLLGACVSRAPSEQPADYVFHNGNVYTVNPDQEWAEAVAVRANEIVYVGDAAGAAAYQGESTETFDLAGKMVLPGFIDGHLHGMGGGLIALGPDLQSDDKEEILERVRNEAESTPAATRSRT